MVKRELERRIRKLNRQRDADPRSVRLASLEGLVFPPVCPACDAPATTQVELEKRVTFTIYSEGGNSTEHQVVRLSVPFCQACADRHKSERGSTSVSDAIDYRMNRDSVSSDEPAWHGFRFRTVPYADSFRKLNAARLWHAKKYAETRAERERSSLIQLLVLIAILAGLALWAYLNR